MARAQRHELSKSHRKKLLRMVEDGITKALAKRGGTVEMGFAMVGDTIVSEAIDNRQQWALQEIVHRFAGKPSQPVEHTGGATWEMVVQHIVNGTPLEITNESDIDSSSQTVIN